MPPPAVVDPWYAGRHFGVVIDAGSSGSRLQIYSWEDPASTVYNKANSQLHILPKVEKGTETGEGWIHKVTPGISSFAEDIASLASYLRPLLAHAMEQIPPSLHSQTPLILLATAGMRLLPSEQQAEILTETCRFFTGHSEFKIESPSKAGPCGNSIRIITGEEEGLFGWIAVNYLMDGFTSIANERTTYGFLDMGGASTQIAFEPGPEHQTDIEALIDVRLRVLSGEEIHHKVFVTTWLGYGTNQARERYVGKAITEFEKSRDNATSQNDTVPDPCLPRGLELTESPVHIGTASDHERKAHRLTGTGSFEECLQKTSSLLNKTRPCPDTPCLMNGVHVPPIDFSVSHFIGVSEYWYSSEHVFGLGGPYDVVQYERAASKFCSRNWTGIVAEHNSSRSNPGGDGEMMKDGKVVEVGKWGPEVELSRLEMQCFKAAWIVNVLHEGIGLPRIVDPEGNATTDGEQVAKQAEKKGLGRPAFQSLDTVGDIAISWTLGKMVLEASKEVPLRSKSDRPLGEPLDDIPQTPDFPIKPIRPPFIDLSALEDRLSPHLPSSLQRDSLGFSPVLFLFAVTFFLLFTLVIYPFRRQLRSGCLRYIRRTTRDRMVYQLEEARPLSGNGYSSPSSPRAASKWFQSTQRFFLSRSRSKSRPSPIYTNQNYPPQIQVNPARLTPSRSSSFPLNVTATSAVSGSRSPSPSPGLVDGFGSPGHPNGLSLSSRSRNTSQISLSSLVSRSGASSRNR